MEPALRRARINSLNLYPERTLIDHHARTHGRADGDLLEVDALGCRRLRLVEVVDQRDQVVLELRCLELRLADDAMDDSGLVHAVGDLAGLGVLHRRSDIRSHGADLGVRHESAGTQDLTELTHDAHGIGARDHAVEIDVAGLHLCGEVFHADDVRACGFRQLDVLARGEHGDAQRLARAMRHHSGTANLLVGLGGVDAEIHGAIDGLVELRGGEFLDHLQRVVDRILLARLNLVLPGLFTFCDCHDLLHHVHAHGTGAASNSAHRGVEIGCRQIRRLGLRDLFELFARDLAHLRGVWRAATLFDADRLANEHRRRRRLHDESEAAIRIHGDDHRDRQVLFHLLRGSVELLAEFHDVDALLTERGPDWRGRIGCACRYLQLYVAVYLLCHDYLPPGCKRPVITRLPMRVPAVAPGLPARALKNFRLFLPD